MPMIYQIDNNNVKDARVNLALEEFCLRQLAPDKDYLIFYVNNPAVVIGRHQNPLEETDQRFMSRHRIRTVRRISGGGTVYHDSGNLNFCFINTFDRSSLTRIKDRVAPVVSGLQTLGIDARLDGRNAILIGDRKVSGNSQFTDLRRITVHGTLLFDSDLDTLHSVLRPSFEHIVSGSPKSIRSPVTNISDHVHRHMDLDGLQQHLLQTIAEEAGGVRRHRLTAGQWDQIRQLAQKKFASWEWTYGRTPPYTVHKSLRIGESLQKAVIRIKNGRIRSVDLEAGAAISLAWRNILQKLHGVGYDEGSLADALNKLAAENSLPPSDRRQLLALVY